MKKNWYFFSTVLLIWGFLLLLAFPPGRILPSGTPPEAGMALALLSFPVLFFVSAFLPCLICCGNEVWKELGFRKPERSDLGPVMMMIPFFVLSAICMLLAKKWGLDVHPQGLVAYAKTCSPGMFLLILLTAGVLAPIGEELAYRKALYSTFERMIPWKWAANGAVSGIFAIMHGLLWQSLTLFVLAVILQAEFRRGNTLRTILMHAVFNWCTLILLIPLRLGWISDL